MTTATKRIPIADAYFCEDCDCVVDSAVQCECGSAALMSLSGVLNRETAEEPADEVMQ